MALRDLKLWILLHWRPVLVIAMVLLVFGPIALLDGRLRMTGFGPEAGEAKATCKMAGEILLGQGLDQADAQTLVMGKLKPRIYMVTWHEGETAFKCLARRKYIEFFAINGEDVTEQIKAQSRFD